MPDATDTRLDVLLPNGDRQSYQLSGGEVIVGRDRSADVQIDDVSVSRVHARLVRTAAGWRIVDAGSANGVWIDGQQVEQATVRINAAIRLGATEIRLTWTPDPAVTQSAMYPPAQAGATAATPPGAAPAYASQPALASAPVAPAAPAPVAAPAARGAPPFALLAQVMLFLSGLGGVLVVVGSGMTWGEADVPLLGTVTLDGMAENREGDVTIILGAIAAVIAVTAIVRPYLAIRAGANFVLGVAILLLVIDDARELQDIAAFVGDLPVVGEVIEPEVGTGLILVAAGGSAILVCAGICMGLLYVTSRYWKATPGSTPSASDGS